VVGCSGGKPQPAPSPASEATVAPQAKVNAAPTSDPGPAPPDDPDAGLKNCCKEECDSDESMEWKVCDGSDLAKKIADDWQSLVSGKRKYEAGAANEALHSAEVYIAKPGPEIQKGCGGNSPTDCFIAYTDAKAARRSCDVADAVAIPFVELAKRALSENKEINLSCHQFFKAVRTEELKQYAK
jgi:hypothetical protein